MLLFGLFWGLFNQYEHDMRYLEILNTPQKKEKKMFPNQYVVMITVKMNLI